MSLIICPECKSEVSDTAYACPRCGYKITDKIGYTQNQYKGKKIMIFGTLMQIFGALILIGGLSDNSNAETISIGIGVLICGFVIKKVGKVKNWFHN